MNPMSENELSVPSIALGKYRHYKGNDYEVVEVALHSETKEPMVVYKTIKSGPVLYWVRPYDMFVEKVVMDGQMIDRFKKVENDV